MTIWQRHLAALALLSAAILAIFWREAADVAGIWWNSSTFTHCLLIVPMIGWLVSQRVSLLRPLTPAYWWPALIWMAGAGLVWLVGEAAGVGLFRQLGLILMLQGAVAATLGEKLVRALLFPLGYALLLVPFGEELVPLLQTLTAHISMVLLHLSGITAEMEGVFITTPAGFFEVAEACSGVNFLIAMLAYAISAAHLCFRSWTRRIVFVVAALATTILANALRAYGTMVAAEIWGIEAAGGIDHIFYGWFFFGAVILLVMLVARRWFDRPANDAAVDVRGLDGVPRFAGPAKLVLPAALAVPLLFVGWGNLVGSRSAALPATIAIGAPPGWRDVRVEGMPWVPRFDGADRRQLHHFSNEKGQVVTVAIGGYERQAEGREVVAFGQGAVDPDSKWAWSASLPAIDGAKTERLLHPGPVLRDAATWYLVDGKITGSSRAAKLAGLRARLLGGDPRALSLIISSEERRGGRNAIEDFLSASGGAKAMADRALKSS
ncbi:MULTISPECIES: EpsI domain-containing exosortase [unclassified Sphingopyxis]|jgi:exosortase A|uniref:exosortase A n=1 Tax=unclassified Sphingopyxis TaxID=2614943 RepID=UPI0006C5AFE4|nr:MULTISPECIES: EpsI domain-containing exosortase [unclassified Sphingopyxis]USI75685.1 EpsI domain-containing exosortase [Sphingopyxis sp. USTB-05]GAO77798.1 eight transmembrane protein EpsH [Sphingopyxis sp. C-1]